MNRVNLSGRRSGASELQERVERTRREQETTGRSEREWIARLPIEEEHRGDAWST